jgi:hypothetical protein
MPIRSNELRKSHINHDHHAVMAPAQPGRPGRPHGPDGRPPPRGGQRGCRTQVARALSCGRQVRAPDAFRITASAVASPKAQAFPRPVPSHTGPSRPHFTPTVRLKGQNTPETRTSTVKCRRARDVRGARPVARGTRGRWGAGPWGAGPWGAGTWGGHGLTRSRQPEHGLGPGLGEQARSRQPNTATYRGPGREDPLSCPGSRLRRPRARRAPGRPVLHRARPA